MPFPFALAGLATVAIVYMSGGYSKKYKKKKTDDYGDDSIDDAIDEAETEGHPVIVWGDIENCTDWYVTEEWLIQVAQPRFQEWLKLAGEDEELQKEDGDTQSMDAAYFILDGQLPANCPEPEGNAFDLQADYPDQDYYYDGSISVVYLYQDLANAVGWALADLEAGGPGILYAE